MASKDQIVRPPVSHALAVELMGRIAVFAAEKSGKGTFSYWENSTSQTGVRTIRIRFYANASQENIDEVVAYAENLLSGIGKSSQIYTHNDIAGRRKNNNIKIWYKSDGKKHRHFWYNELPIYIGRGPKSPWTYGNENGEWEADFR